MAWTDQQGAALNMLARVAPAVQQAVAHTVERLWPTIGNAADRIRQRPELVRQRRQEAELVAGRERLLRWHMKLWWGETRWGYRTPSDAMETQWKQKAAVEEARQRAVYSSHAGCRNEAIRRAAAMVGLEGTESSEGSSTGSGSASKHVAGPVTAARAVA